jgi:predicted ATP-grasp superfamily ATP-dependent carboligase
MPDVHSPGYVEAVRAESANGYVAVLPTSDTTLIALSDPGARYIDKGALQAGAAAAGLPFPPTEAFAGGPELLEAADRLEYPVIVKPAVGKPPRRANCPSDIRRWWATSGHTLLVQPFLTDPITTVNGVLWEGRLAGVAHQRYLRVWPPDAGMALAAVTVEEDRRLEERVLALMEGYTGIFEVELCGPYLLDVNARVYGSVMLAAKAGANLPGVYCSLRRGKRVPQVRARPGVFYRWLEADIRYAFTGLRSGRLSLMQAARILRPVRGAAHGGPESLTDPGPMLARLKYAIRTGGWGRGHAGLLSRP